MNSFSNKSAWTLTAITKIWRQKKQQKNAFLILSAAKKNKLWTYEKIITNKKINWIETDQWQCHHSMAITKQYACGQLSIDVYNKSYQQCCVRVVSKGMFENMTHWHTNTANHCNLRLHIHRFHTIHTVQSKFHKFFVKTEIQPQKKYNEKPFFIFLVRKKIENRMNSKKF